MVDGICEVASRFATIAANLCLQLINPDTFGMIQGRIEWNVAWLRPGGAIL